MELQLVAHVNSHEEDVTVSIKKLADPVGFLILQQGTNRLTVSIEELKEAVKKLEEYDGETTE